MQVDVEMMQNKHLIKYCGTTDLDEHLIAWFQQMGYSQEKAYEQKTILRRARRILRYMHEIMSSKPEANEHVHIYTVGYHVKCWAENWLDWEQEQAKQKRSSKAFFAVMEGEEDVALASPKSEVPRPPHLAIVAEGSRPPSGILQLAKSPRATLVPKPGGLGLTVQPDPEALAPSKPAKPLDFLEGQGHQPHPPPGENPGPAVRRPSAAMTTTLSDTKLSCSLRCLRATPLSLASMEATLYCGLSATHAMSAPSAMATSRACR